MCVHAVCLEMQEKARSIEHALFMVRDITCLEFANISFLGLHSGLASIFYL